MSGSALWRCDVVCISGRSGLTHRRAGGGNVVVPNQSGIFRAAHLCEQLCTAKWGRTASIDLAFPPFPVEQFLQGVPDSQQGQPCCRPSHARISPSMEITFPGGSQCFTVQWKVLSQNLSQLYIGLHPGQNHSKSPQTVEVENRYMTLFLEGKTLNHRDLIA